MIKIENLVGGYKNTPIIKGMDLEIEQGEFFALLGPNGSGKTTLFKLITGQLPIREGKIILSGKEISSYSKLEKAKKVSVLTQEIQVSFDYTVEEIISLGRYPHQKGMLKQLSIADQKMMSDVMEKTKISHYRYTPFRMISGGEKQRVLLAKALAQEPEILLLDEPTNHLDINHTFQILDLLKEQQQETGLTVLAILHDLNIASLYADRIGLLEKGKLLEVGGVDVLRKEEQLKKVYEVEVKSQSHPVVPKPQILMTPGHVITDNPFDFNKSYKIVKNSTYIHVQFFQALRTISNGVIGEGIQWAKHFCNFHVDKHYDCSNPKKDLQEKMNTYDIPYEQAVGMMTAVNLEDMVMETKEIEGIPMMVIVTAGIGNAVDITNEYAVHPSSQIGTINTMLFIDAHFTDGALVNGYMSATEAKVKVLQDLQIKDPESDTIATGTSTDALLLGLTQQGEVTPYAGSGTVMGKGIGQLVYHATMKAVKKYLKRVQR
ncbi:adenosylcobinamide amidohydrolase [Oceanobacillus bengalensis]|uniref:ATP-binding cassette domain-containing protein n=1 Tax=Oceanobacillus bengalensis TaxID=1435466 RepID=A0A494YTG3_9BACI|nr:adenosylcobinamide amidohydrolase [Oceanobacillus bengalensis]RKQ13421.1 ATP-binding cassette domain-containing protein [Oceanobacillus bengalensis]